MMQPLTADPLAEAIARTILRHQLGCDQPAQPPARITAAATEIVDAVTYFLNDTPTDATPALIERLR